MRLAVDEPERMLAMASALIRRQVRAAQRCGFSIRQSTDEDSFQRFYWRFYRPFVEARHGDAAVVYPPGILRRRLRRGAITWASLDGAPVLGSAYEIVGDTLRQLVVGAEGGRIDDLAHLATCAARLENMRLAHATGLRWLDLGGTAPWLSDGITAHKRAWGAEVIDRPGNHRLLLVGWRRWTAAVARYLAAFPLILRRSWGFGAVAGGIGEPAAALERWRRMAPWASAALWSWARAVARRCCGRGSMASAGSCLSARPRAPSWSV